MTEAAQIEREVGGAILDAGPPLLEDENFPFMMTSVPPRRTGVPMVVWVGPGYGARHDVRVKVCMVPGPKLHPGQLATVGVRPEPRLLHGRLSANEFELVARWIRLNEAAIVEFWESDGDYDGGDFLEVMKRV